MDMILPPYAALIGAVLAPQDSGPPWLVLPYAEVVLGRPGFLHGGAIAGLLDLAALIALRHALGDDRATLTPVTVTVDFMRGGRDKPTQAVGSVTRLGTRVANVEAIAWQDSRDTPIAAARMNFLIGR